MTLLNLPNLDLAYRLKYTYSIMKKNFTVRLEEMYIKRAKIRALLDSKTVSQIVKDFLIDYAKKVDVTETEIEIKRSK